MTTKIGKAEVSLLDLDISPPVLGGLIGSLFEHFFIERLFSELSVTERILWRRGDPLVEADVVYEANKKYSFEIKTASTVDVYTSTRSTNAPGGDIAVKEKSGYYLIVRYSLETAIPTILWIRFGWLDQNDWSNPEVAGRSQRLRLRQAWPKMQLLYQTSEKDK